MTSDELRARFLSFYEGKGHKVIASSSLIPHGDPTLLLTSAGMVQMKPYFLGESTPPARRLASCQKCFRTTDIERVGDTSHLTFFEMLGNFSIGDYFKKEAIDWAWEFITQEMDVPPDRLWATVFTDDDEAFGFWRKHLPAEKIIRFGEEDNFWGPAGDSGPCGPDTEIFYDYGKEHGCYKPDCGPNCKCGRFIEIGTLVFMQFNQDKSGKRTPLPRPSIDTGMGVERNTAVVQGKTSVYETDLFVPVLERISKLSGKKYGKDEAVANAMRVVAEHSRGIAFLIGDGVSPSNEGRGYVLRRLLRRAALFGKRLGLEKGFLAETTGTVINLMKQAYPELEQRKDFILKVVSQEETRFADTLNTGLELLDDLLSYREANRGALPELISFLQGYKPSSENAAAILEQHGFAGGSWAAEIISQLTYNFLKELEEKRKTNKNSLDAIERWGQRVSGDEAFKLYDTYGFPVELTKEIAAERGFSVDLDGFDSEMESQREKARASHKFIIQEGGLTPEGFESLKQGISFKSEFVGYKKLSATTKIELINFGRESRLEQGQEGNIVLSKTPFYGEMGGQVGDIGEILSSAGRFLVTNTDRVLSEIVVHHGRMVSGIFKVGDKVTAEVDRERRLDIARNHTATHILQAALRDVLGEHVQQRGSLVTPERFRFDFSHLVAMTKEEIDQAQQFVNDKIRLNLPVYDEQMPYKQAVASGTIALFDEKYGDVVRVLRIGKPPISAELCGGTHAHTTGEIGFFQILSESSVGSGLRRIEAVTGRGAEQYVKQRIHDLEKVAASLEAKPDDVVNQAQNMAEALKNERRQTMALESELAKLRAESLVNQVETVNGVKILAVSVPSTRIEAMREMSDMLQTKLTSAVIVLGTVSDDKPLFLATVTPDLVAKGYDAGKIIKEVAKVAGGGGGGKANLAQAGGRDKDKLDEALRQTVKYLQDKKS